MTYFIRSAGVWNITDSTHFDVREKLDARNYILQFNSFMKEYYLIEAESFLIPQKIYGSLFKNTDRIFNTFNDREKSTGILLHGEKGSGKTLLSQHLCQVGNSYNMPVIMINQPFINESGNTIEYFIKFLQKMTQSCVLLFDEFEKTFDPAAQENILLTLSGTKFNKMLFLFVANERKRISEFFFNRPERIFYKFGFNGLEPDFIKEYCEDVLINKSVIESTVNIASAFRNLNFDMLKSIVEEINRYGESPVNAIKFLNVDFNSEEKKYDIFLITKDGDEKLLCEGMWLNPYKHNQDISSKKLEGYIEKKKTLEEFDYDVAIDQSDSVSEDDEEEYYGLTIAPEFLIKVDAVAGVFIYNVDGVMIKLVEKKFIQFSFNSAAF